MLFAHSGPFELTVMLPKLMPSIFNKIKIINVSPAQQSLHEPMVFEKKRNVLAHSFFLEMMDF